jgi:hypothetical protein
MVAPLHHKKEVIDAKPVEINGKEMHTVFPLQDGSAKGRSLEAVQFG